MANVTIENLPELTELLPDDIFETEHLPFTADAVANRVKLSTFDKRYLTPSYGLSWNESQDTYTRVGRLAGIACGSSPGDALLPIQASMRRCVLNDKGEVVYYLDPYDSTKKEGGGTANLDGTDGQVKVEIPAYFYGYQYDAANHVHTYRISFLPEAGLSIHPAFIKNGKFVPYRYIGAYEGVLYDVSAGKYTNGLYLPAGSGYTFTFSNANSTITADNLSHAFTNLEPGDKIVVSGTESAENDGTYTVSSATDTVVTTVESLTDENSVDCTIEIERDWANDILGSVSGKAPIVQGTRANFRAAAARRGTGWRQQDHDLIHAVILLYLIEFGNWNSQAMIGNGLTDWSSAWPAWNNYNPINKTGLSNSLGNATGNVSNGDGVAGSYMSYRGIENFYGHLWKWIEGLNINDHVPYVCNDDSAFADDTAAGYTPLGVTLAASNGYQVTLAQIARSFLPLSVGGSSSTYICDYYWQSTGWRVAKLGGRADDGANAGVACLAANDASSNLHRRISGRLAY